VTKSMGRELKVLLLYLSRWGFDGPAGFKI
jgi:hypothetical protein